MESDSGISIAELRVDGGATVNDLMMQFQSDIVSVRVLRPEVIETTALGAAYLAGLAVGFWGSVEEISAQWKVSGDFQPGMENDLVKEKLHAWSRAVKAVLAWSAS
jgi:glycerol kinase